MISYDANHHLIPVRMNYYIWRKIYKII